MMRSRYGMAMATGAIAAAWSVPDRGASGDGRAGAAANFLTLLTERFEFTFAQLPALGDHLMVLLRDLDGHAAIWMAGIVVAGLLAEFVARLALSRARSKAFDRLVANSPLRAFFRTLLLDVLALVALAVAGRIVLGRMGGDANSTGHQLGQMVLHALVYWRGFNVIFRAFLRPGAPEGRIAPVESDAARRLLVALNLVVLLPLVAGLLARALPITGATREMTGAAIILYVPFFAAALVYVVWHWRFDMAAWLTAMVAPKGLIRKLKLDAARNWWMAGLAFYTLMGDRGRLRRPDGKQHCVARHGVD